MTRTTLPAGTTGPGAWTEIDATSALYQPDGQSPIQVTFKDTTPTVTEPAFTLDRVAIQRGDRAEKLWARSTTSGSASDARAGIIAG